MADVEERLATLEARSEKVLHLLQQAVNGLFAQRQRIEDLEGRLKAHTLVTTTVLQLAHRSDPEAFNTILALLELSENDLARAKEDKAAIRELREILGTLRAVSRAGEVSAPDYPHQ
jgi:hypothetical protein